ncbi:YktB family protein [Cytobacillus sp. Hm23]
MNFQGFSADDFDTFMIPELDDRMTAIKQLIRPKFEFIGTHFVSSLTTLTGNDMFFHVAKHARRTKNPPNDTWVAFSSNARGYKMLPHFQVGLWGSHLFIIFAVIYEYPYKENLGITLAEQYHELKKQIPNNFVWSTDHTKPTATAQENLNDEQILHMFNRLQSIKKAEILCGVHIDKDDVINLNGKQLLNIIDTTFKTLMPLYELATSSSTVLSK